MKQFIKCALLSCLVAMFLLDTAMGQLRRNAPRQQSQQWMPHGADQIHSGRDQHIPGTSQRPQQQPTNSQNVAVAGLRFVDLQMSPIRSSSSAPPRYISSVAFSADGSEVITVMNDGRIQGWDAQSGRELQGTRSPARNVNSSTPTSTTRSITSPDGRRMATQIWEVIGGERFGPQRAITRILDTNSGRELHRLEGSLPFSPAVFSPDGKMIATEIVPNGDFARQFTQIWDTDSGRALQRLGGKQAVFSPCGKKIATMGVAWDGLKEVQIWEADSGRRLHNLIDRRVGQQIQSFSFSPDGKKIVALGISVDFRTDSTTYHPPRIWFLE